MKKIFSLFVLSAAALLLPACAKEKGIAEGGDDTDRAPQLVSIVPPTYVAGGTAVISGLYFSETIAENRVEIGGNEAVVTDARKDRLTVTLPAHDDGRVEVKVSVRGRKAPQQLWFTYAQPVSRDVKITNISPASTFAGEPVTIYGENFSTTREENAVTFGNVVATVRNATKTSLIVTAPEHAVGEVTVKVTVRSDKSATGSFTYLKTPVLRIDSVSPASGKIGDVVRISGEGFSTTAADNHVTMGGMNLVVKQCNAAYLDVYIPDLPGGNYSFNVTVGSRSTSGGSFALAKTWRVETVAGSGRTGCTDGVGTAAVIGNTQDAILAQDGLIWFTQRSENPFSIRTFNPSTKEVRTVKKATDAGCSFFKHPWGGAFAPDGSFWFCNKSGNTVGRISGGAATQVQALDKYTAYTQNPMCIQFDNAGTAYVLCRATPSKIYKFNGTEVTDSLSVPFPVECMKFNPAKTHLFLAGNAGSRFAIYTLDVSNGNLSAAIAGNGQKPNAESYTDGTPGEPTTATIGLVEGLTFSPDGKLWISDATSGTFRCLTPGTGGDYSTGTLKTIAGVPFSNTHADGLGTEAGLKYPVGSVALSNESIILFDSTNFRIRRVYLQ